MICLKMIGRDLLIVLSDSGKLSFLTFCNEMNRYSLYALLDNICLFFEFSCIIALLKSWPS